MASDSTALPHSCTVAKMVAVYSISVISCLNSSAIFEASIQTSEMVKCDKRTPDIQMFN